MPTELNTLKRALRLSEGQFSLLLVRCAYRALREDLLVQLRADKHLNTQLVALPSHTHNLLELLKNAVAKRGAAETAVYPTLLVTGLEQVDNLEQLLATTNQLRDEFPRLLPCPLVLWVTDSVLQCLIRVAPDFESWGTTLEFDWDDAALLHFIEQKASTLLAEWLNPVLVLPSVPHVPSYDPSQLAELQTAQQSLSQRGIRLPMSIHASLDLLRACDAEAGSEAARLAYQSSQHWWQQQSGSELNQAVCLVLLAYNWQILAQQHPQQREAAWAQAVQCWQQALELFKQVHREDLYAKFINALGQVYVLQLCVVTAGGATLAPHSTSTVLETLDKLAHQAEALHQKNPRRLAQAQGLLAEVAWQRHGRINISDKLFILGDNRDRAWFLLLQALALENPEASLQHLQAGLQFIAPQQDVYLYLRLLRTQRQVHFELRDYLAAFRVKLRQYDLEQQYDLRAFNGAGRLREEGNWEASLSVSGRNNDVQNLLARMERDDQPLTIIYGPSGVGKSSLIQSGFVVALKHIRVHARPLLPVLQTVYTDWAKELQQNLDIAQGLQKPKSLTHQSHAQRVQDIVAQLRRFVANNYMIVLIFEQFEEFFFACKEPTQRKRFYEFLQICLDLPEVKVILALREDYLHHLLECNERLAELPAVNNNVLDKKILYYLGNFSREQAKTVILSLTHNTPFQLEADLIEALLDDFSAGGDGVSPIELQVVGNQLQHDNIRDLASYRARGPKTALVERYVQTVVQDCGAEYEHLASLVMYLLTDEDNTRPLKTRAELAEILNIDTGLDVVLAILTQSRLVFVHPGDPTPYYQLVHDYLVPFIRRQQSEDLQARLESEQRQRRYSEAELKRVLQRQRLRDYRVLGLIGVLCLAAVTWVMRAETDAQITVQALTVKRLWSSHQQLDALLVGLQQAKLLESWQGRSLPSDDRHAAIQPLQEVMQGITELNRLDAHRRRVLNVRYSADGKMLASTGDDGQTLIWDTHGRLLARLEHLSSYRPPMSAPQPRETEQKNYDLPIWSAAFHPDGQRLAVTVNLRRRQVANAADNETDYAIELWSLDCSHADKTKEIAVKAANQAVSPAMDEESSVDTPCRADLQDSLHGHQKTIYSLNFSPDGRYLASAADDHSIRLWTAEGAFLHELRGHQAPVHSLAFSPDNQMLLSASDDQTLRLWSLDGKMLGVLRGHEDWALNATFSPDGQYIASVGRDGVRVWRLLDDAERHSTHTHTERGNETTAQAHALAEQLQPAHNKAQRHEDYVWGVAFSPDGQWIATAGLDNVIKIWNFRPQQQPPLQLNNTLPGHPRGVLSVAFNPRKPTQLASAGLDKLVRLWQVEPARYTQLRGNESYAGKADEPTFTHLAFSPDSQLLATGGQEGDLILWDQRGRRYATLRQGQDKAHAAPLSALEFSPNGAYLLSGDQQGELCLWDRQGRLSKKLAGHSADIRSLSFSPDGAVILSVGLDGTVRLWRSDGQSLDRLDGYAAAFSPNGQYLAVAPRDGLIRLLYLNGGEAYSLSNPTHNNTHIRFTPDGKLLFSRSWQGDIDIWGNQGQHISHILRKTPRTPLSEPTTDFSISPDSQRFAIGNPDGGVQVWNIAGKLIHNLAAHQGAVTQARFSSDGQWLATAGVDRSVALWQRDGRLMARFQEHEDTVLDVRFSPDGRLLASASADKTVRLWSLDFDVNKLREQGCAWGQDYLNTSQMVWEADRLVCK